MKNRILFILLCSTMCLLLAGCAEKMVDESQLKADLYNSDTFSKYSSDLEMEITDFEIVKRQTAKENKSDIVWVKAEAASNAVKGTMYFEMIYGLYNDGWMLDSITDDSTDLWHFEPLNGAADDLIQQYVPSGAEIDSVDVDLENGIHTVSYTIIDTHTYCDIVYIKQLMFTFASGHSSEVQWTYAGVIADSSYEDWKISGDWYGSNDEPYITVWRKDTGNVEVYLSIEDFSPPIGCILQHADADNESRFNAKLNFGYYRNGELKLSVGDTVDVKVDDYYNDINVYEIFAGYKNGEPMGNLFISYDRIYFDHIRIVELKPVQ